LGLGLGVRVDGISICGFRGEGFRSDGVGGQTHKVCGLNLWGLGFRV